jgi:AAA family ATP:ADP antiporter
LVIHRILEEARVIQDTLSILYLQAKLDDRSKTNKTELANARKNLVDLLEKRLDAGLERIFRLLGLRFPPDEINSAFKSFQSNKSDVRIGSIEFLDNLLDTRLKRVIIPLLETTILDTHSEEALRNLNLNVLAEKECYSMLLNGNDIKIKIAVLYLIGQLQDPKYFDLIEKHRSNPNQKVRDFAEKTFISLSSH